MQSFSMLAEYCLARRHRLLAILFVAYGLSGCLGIAVIMPPFLNPDEPAHFMRADAISLGGLIGTRQSPTRAGGVAHERIEQAGVVIWSALEDPDRRINRQVLDSADAFVWGGSTRYMWFPNTAIYPPTSYIPSVLGIFLGRATHLSIDATLVLARCLNALVYIAIGAVAIMGSGSAAPLLFSVLLLPTSIVQAAAVTQDGWMFALSALAMSLALPSLRDQASVGRVRTLLLTVALAMVIVARPPYLPLAVLPLLLRGTSLRFRLACVIAITGACILWSAMVAAFAMIPQPTLDPLGPPDASRQLQLLWHHPGMIGPIIARTLASFAYAFYIQFIGRGGWLLPLDYYGTAWCIVLLSVLLSALTTGRSAWRWHAAIIAGMILSATALMFAVCYVTLSGPGAPEVWGMQGRYFIPVALLVPGMLPAVHIRGQRGQALALGVISIFPAITIPTLFHAVIWQYYVGL